MNNNMKKGFLKKRRNAVIICIAVMALSTLFGINKSLGRKNLEVADYFYDGVYSKQDDYTLKSIRSQLEVRTEASMNTLTVSDKYDEVSDESKTLRTARNRLMDLLYEEGGPPELFEANKTLEYAYNNLYAKLMQLISDEADKTNLQQDHSRMRGAASQIEKSKYNEAVREYRRQVLFVFPTNILRNLCFTPEPELFE